MALEWEYQESGLGLRDDDFSWQGSVKGDPHFFLRRSKDEPDTVTDLLFGQLSDNTVEFLFAEFMSATGGIRGDRLTFSSIGQRSDNYDATVIRFDRIVKIGTNAAVQTGRIVKNCFLDQDGNYWNAVLELHPKVVTAF